MAAVAGLRAIATAGLDPDDIDLILVGTLTPDYAMPSTAALVKERSATSGRGDGPLRRLLGLRLRLCTANAYVASGMGSTFSSSAPRR